MTEETFVDANTFTNNREEFVYDLLMFTDEDVQEVIRTGVAVRGVLKFLHSLPSTDLKGNCCGSPGIEELKSFVDVVELSGKRAEILQNVDRLVKLPYDDFKWIVNYFSPSVDVDEALSMKHLRLSYALLLQCI